MYRVLILVICAFVGVQSYLSSNVNPCRRDDNVCLTLLADRLLNIATVGDPAMNLEKLDPMHQKNLEGRFVIINYSLYNSTILGFQDCHVVNVKLASEKNSMHFHMVCPYIKMYGIYEISGLLIIVPIEGKGDYTLECTDYHLYVDTETKITVSNDGKRHLKFKTFKVNADLKGGMVTNLTNLFNGEYKELADTALKFANDQWKPVSKELQGPVVYANVRKIIKNLNKYLKTVYLDKIIIY